MKNTQRILLLIGCFWALLGSAQKDTNHHLWVNVIDAFTGQALSLDRNVKVDLLQPTAPWYRQPFAVKDETKEVANAK